ncbi:hypothetical protein IFM89_005403 [Coptis chinensis]|uniref:AMP-activated protein kinase glycogen-binding domain-containing protein n=1 Tax=Coptis chinensis TaxID=261450 RepID=A0A835IYD4_9MAGN|nr:hypothetical protein IFM89_005403 [Coptis chinensis]
MASLTNVSKNLIFSSYPIKKTCSSLRFESLFIPSRRKDLSFSCFYERGLSRKKWENKVWESEGGEGGGEDSDLEERVLEFMKNSKTPDLFPTHDELIEAGRMDLVKDILRQGGWLAYGWDLGEEEEEEEVFDDRRMFQQRFYGGRSDSLEEFEAGHSSNGSSNLPSSSGRRMESEKVAGVAGILSRLEKEREQSFDLGSRDKESKARVSLHDIHDDDDLQLELSKVILVLEADAVKRHILDLDMLYMFLGKTVRRSERNSASVSGSSGKEFVDDAGGTHGQNESFSDCQESTNLYKPDTWRKWSNKRAGSSDVDFEAAEIEEHMTRNDEMVAKGRHESGKRRTELSTGDIKQITSRLQDLDSELASVLHLLSCKADVSDKVMKNSSEKSHSLSDTWEFRETEIMKARDKLRSLRAQLAVLQGKMALTKIEAQKKTLVKQKKIRDARKALSLLRTACIIWPNSASEVLLAGSFDGWTSQRKMERSSPGIFSLCLKLYPGRYEIKFIVDGEWKIDPLRPIANHYGYQNNLLFIS